MQNRPREAAPVERAPSEAGCRPGWARRSVIVQLSTLDDLRALAFYRRRTIAAELDEALQTHLRSSQGELSKARRLYAERQTSK